MIHEFIQEYGWYIAAFLAGFIVTMLWWWKEHPEDFWHKDEDTEQTKATLSSDKVGCEATVTAEIKDFRRDTSEIEEIDHV